MHRDFPAAASDRYVFRKRRPSLAPQQQHRHSHTELQAQKNSKYYKYRKLDYFMVPNNFGITIINKNGKITKLNQEGEIVNDTN